MNPVANKGQFTLLPPSKLFLLFLLPFHFKISMNMRITTNKITTYLTFRGRLLVRVDCICLQFPLFMSKSSWLCSTFRTRARLLLRIYSHCLLLVTCHCSILPNEIGSDHFPRPRLLVWLYQWLYSVYEKP